MTSAHSLSTSLRSDEMFYHGDRRMCVILLVWMLLPAASRAGLAVRQINNYIVVLGKLPYWAAAAMVTRRFQPIHA